MVSVLAAGCGNETTNGNNTNVKNEETMDYERVKLDMIQPIAYGSVSGLDLEPGTTISLIGRGGPAAYWDAVEEGAKKAVEEINANLKYKGDEKVKVVFSAPEKENDVDSQVNILDEELARYPAAVGIAMVDSTACEVQFDLATENNIPIVAFDSGTDYHNIVSMIKTNDEEAAAMAANKLCALIGDEGDVIVVAHDTVSKTAQVREHSFKVTVEAEHPSVNIVETYHLDELKEKAKEMKANGVMPEDAEISHTDVLKHLLETHLEVKAIYATSESAADAVISVQKALENTDIRVVSFDGGKSQISRLEDGKLDGLVVQNPYGMGYATVVAAARAVLEQGNEAVVDTGYTWVTQENLKEEAIKNMMY